MSERVPDLISVDELAARWSVSSPTIRRYIRLEGLPALKIGRNRQSRVRIRLSDAEAWLSARAQEVADARAHR